LAAQDKKEGGRGKVKELIYYQQKGETQGGGKRKPRSWRGFASARSEKGEREGTNRDLLGFLLRKGRHKKGEKKEKKRKAFPRVAPAFSMNAEKKRAERGGPVLWESPRPIKVWGERCRREKKKKKRRGKR